MSFQDSGTGYGRQPAPNGGAALSDLLTTAKNIVTAINAAAQVYLNVNGTANVALISTATVVKGAPGRVVTISITTAGSANGAIYDAVSTTDTTKPIYTIPNTIGVVHVNLPANYGIVVAPGTSQVITVGYS